MLAPAADTPGGSGPGAPVQLGHVRELELLPPREVEMTVGQRADAPQDLVPDHRRQRGDEAHRGEPTGTSDIADANARKRPVSDSITARRPSNSADHTIVSGSSARKKSARPMAKDPLRLAADV